MENTACKLCCLQSIDLESSKGQHEILFYPLMLEWLFRVVPTATYLPYTRASCKVWLISDWRRLIVYRAHDILLFRMLTRSQGKQTLLNKHVFRWAQWTRLPVCSKCSTYPCPRPHIIQSNPDAHFLSDRLALSIFRSCWEFGSSSSMLHM